MSIIEVGDIVDKLDLFKGKRFRVVEAVADNFFRFDEIPSPYSIKIDLDRPSKRYREKFIESILCDLCELGYLTEPTRLTGRRFSTESGRELFKAIKEMREENKNGMEGN